MDSTGKAKIRESEAAIKKTQEIAVYRYAEKRYTLHRDRPEHRERLIDKCRLPGRGLALL